MKWVIFLTLLLEWNCIYSQPTNEKVRDARQLNFEQCCPCPTVDRIKDNVLGTNNVPSDCPCSSVDSETASSIFMPTSKAVQSFDRPFKSKDEPKPLLNPEVGLASSVLETLRDVTDLEYQEALAREVARNALQEIDADAEKIPLAANRNIFNNILNHRNQEAMDVIPEASHNEEASFMHPTLSRTNELGHIEIQPQRSLLKDFRLSKPANLHKKNYDMDNGPSDIKENTLPSKNNLLDDIKIKTNLLKSKLFSNNGGLLQRITTDKSYGNPQKKKSDWRLVAALDNLKSKFDSKSLPVEEKTKDLLFLSNNIFNNNDQNNKKIVLTPLRNAQQKDNYITDEVLFSEPINFALPKEMQRFKNAKDHDIDSNADTSILYPVYPRRDDCNLQTDNTKKIYHTNIIDSNTSNIPIYIPPHNSTEILDTIPSPSEIIDEDKRLTDPVNNEPHEDNNIENLSEINIEPNPEQITHNIHEDSDPDSIAKPTDIQDNTSNLSIEANSEEADNYIPENVCTAENSKTDISSFYIVSTPEPLTTPTTGGFNIPITQNEEENINSMNAERMNRRRGSPQSSNNLLDKNKDSQIKILPTISEDITKTFENVKNINEKWQEKIKLDMQDALQLINVKNNVAMQEKLKKNKEFIPEILDIPHKSNGKTSNTLSTNELQKMSDSILTLSSVNQNPDSSLNSSVKEISDSLLKMDSNGEPSETISCFTPAEVYSSNEAEEKILNNNKKVSENPNHFRNLNTGKIYRGFEDEHKKISSEKSLNIKEPSSDNFDKNEMLAGASEQKPQRNSKFVPDNLRYLQSDLDDQPNKEFDDYGRPLLNVNNFFDNVKSTISNVLSKQNENIFRQIGDNEDIIDSYYKKNRQDRHFDFDKPTLSLKKNDNLLKASEAIETDTYSIDRYKSNFNPYKARVAVPKSFAVKPILINDETVHKRSRTLNNPRNKLPKIYPTNTFVYNSNENLGNENLGPSFRELDNNPNSESTVLSPNIFQKSFKSSGSKNLGSLKDRTEEAFQNIHKTLGSPLRAVTFKENNGFLNKNIGNDIFFETMASRRNELNEKLQAINLDLNGRLSSLSQRMADSILPSLNSQHLPQRRVTAKSRSDVRNKQGLDSLRRINVPSNIRSVLPKRKLSTQLIQSDDHLSKLLQKSPRLRENSMSQRSTLVKPLLKSSLVNKSPKTETKTYKPKFKDNKIISMTATARPKIEILGYKPPTTIKKVSTLTPKISAHSVEKKPFVSRLKSSEPHSLGSENIMSRVLLDNKKDSDKFAMDVSTDKSDEKFDSNFKDVKAAKQEVERNLTLSKIREAFKAKIMNRNSNNKDNNLKSSTDTDIEIQPSALDNVNQITEGSLRENVQYKCKMLCTKDK